MSKSVPKTLTHKVWRFYRGAQLSSVRMSDRIARDAIIRPVWLLDDLQPGLRTRLPPFSEIGLPNSPVATTGRTSRGVASTPMLLAWAADAAREIHFVIAPVCGYPRPQSGRHQLNPKIVGQS